MTKTLKLSLIIGGVVVALALAIILPIMLIKNEATVKFYDEASSVMFSETIESGMSITKEDAKLNSYIEEDVIIFAYYLSKDFSTEPVTFPFKVTEDVELYAQYAKVLTSEDFDYVEYEYSYWDRLYQYNDYTGPAINESVVVIDGDKDNVYKNISLQDGVFNSADFTNLEKVHFSNSVGHFHVGVLNFFNDFAKMTIDNDKYISESYDEVLKGFDTSFRVAGSVKWSTFDEMYEDVKTEPADEDIIVYYKNR